MMNNKERIYLSSPHMTGSEMSFINQAFESNWIAPLGPHVTAFEQEICQYVGVNAAVAVSSGTAAIHLALRLLDIGPGDLVLCSSLTFIGSVNPILYQGAVPVFIDSEPETWNMSPGALQKAFDWAVTRGTLPKAVIIVNIYGQSADMYPLLNICSQYDVPVIEDAAESLGATYRGKASGTWGKFGIFSFNGNKIITTAGGGMLVSNDIDAIKKALFWATQARDPAAFYQHSEIGYNYRMSNVLAGIGRGQLQALGDRVKKRRAVFEYYYDNLKDINGFGFMPESAHGVSNRWLTVLTIYPHPMNTTPARLIDMMEAENIECRRVWKPMHLQPLFKDCVYFPHSETASVSDQCFETGLCIPSGSNLTQEDQDRIIDLLRSCFNNRKTSI
jgi:pyridoxal phosphate-dependent aminotransferase EpsN